MLADEDPSLRALPPKERGPLQGLEGAAAVRADAAQKMVAHTINRPILKE